MYRLRFTTEDLVRTRLSTSLGPFGETAFAAERLRHRRPGAVYDGWRHQVRGSFRQSVRLLADLFPVDGRGVDLSTLVGASTTIDEGCERFLGVNADSLRGEIRWYGTFHRLSRWSKSLADGAPAPRREFVDAFAALHDVAVRPYWNQIDGCLRADLAARMRRLAVDGVERLLATISPPHVRWRPPMLEVSTPHAVDATVDLGGRGLLLVPSVFVGAFPSLTFDLATDGATPRLIYPVVRDVADARDLWSRAGSTDLDALLGRTRSAILETIADGCGTGEISHRLGISPSSVSQHTAVLRAAGLINTWREATHSLHVLSPLGAALLNSAPPGTGSEPRK